MNSFATFLQATALEAGHGAAPKAAEAQLLDVDGTVFVMLGLFLFLLLVLWQFLWKPYLRVRDERVSRVDGAREEAAKLDANTARRIEHIETALVEARRIGSADMAKLRLQAQEREQRIVAEAQEGARKTLAEARAKLAASLATEKAHLQVETIPLARAIASKALGRGLV